MTDERRSAAWRTLFWTLTRSVTIRHPHRRSGSASRTFNASWQPHELHTQELRRPFAKRVDRGPHRPFMSHCEGADAQPDRHQPVRRGASAPQPQVRTVERPRCCRQARYRPPRFATSFYSTPRPLAATLSKCQQTVGWRSSRTRTAKRSLYPFRNRDLSPTLRRWTNALGWWDGVSEFGVLVGGWRGTASRPAADTTPRPMGSLRDEPIA